MLSGQYSIVLVGIIYFFKRRTGNHATTQKKIAVSYYYCTDCF